MQAMPSRQSSNGTHLEVQVSFSRALAVVRSLSMSDARWQPSTVDKLRLYGLYKQAVEGECHVARPSSRLVVLHAKWKAWDQLRQLSSEEAQKQYVLLLVDILFKFIERYPGHELVPSLRDSIQYLQLNSDAYPPFTETMEDGHFQQIEEEELIQPHQSALNSPPPSLYLTHRQQQTNQRYPYSSNDTPSTTYTSPVTPDDSFSVQQQRLQQQKQQWYDRNRSHAQQQQQQQPFTVDRFRQPPFHDSLHDGISDADTIDREVAAATSGLGLVSPDQHPYHSFSASHPSQQHRTDTSTRSNQTNQQENRQTTTVANNSSGRGTLSKADNRMTPHFMGGVPSSSDNALESLQTEVAALTEQLDHFRKTLAENKMEKQRWSWLWLIKTLVKHASINLLILTLVFLVLLRRKSPIAYAIIAHVGPRLQAILHYIMQKAFFWKLTV